MPLEGARNELEDIAWKNGGVGAAATRERLRLVSRALDDITSQLSSFENSGWERTLTENERLVESSRTLDLLLKALDLFLIFFVVVLAWVSFRRDEAERRLLHSESLNRSIVNSIADMVFVVAADGTITACNEAAARVFGHKTSELLGQNLYSLDIELVDDTGKTVGLQDRPAFRALAGETGVKAVVHGIRSGGGELRWLSITASCLPATPRGRPAGRRWSPAPTSPSRARPNSSCSTTVPR